MSLKKVVLGSVVAVVAVASLAIAVVLLNLDSLTKAVIEKAGSEATQTQVTLEQVEISLSDAHAELHGLVIGTPEGFELSPHAVEIRRLSLDIDRDTISAPVIVIRELLVDGLQVVIEEGNYASGGINSLQALGDNLSRLEENADTAEPPENSGPGNEKQFMVKSFRFINGSVQLYSRRWEPKHLAIVDTTLNDLGTETVGLTSEQLGQVLSTTVMANSGLLFPTAQ